MLKTGTVRLLFLLENTLRPIMLRVMKDGELGRREYSNGSSVQGFENLLILFFGLGPLV